MSHLDETLGIQFSEKEDRKPLLGIGAMPDRLQTEELQLALD